LAAEQSDFRLVLEAMSEATPGEFEIRLTSTASVPEKNEKQEYSIPDLKTYLVIEGDTAISRVAQAN
jgi:hypothetical protein